MNKLKAIIWAAVSSEIQAHEDKYSIGTQLADAEALCVRNDWVIIDKLVVPGHSRDYYTLDEVTKATISDGITAFLYLKQHINSRDFDVFICRDANRFARKASLLHEIVDRIIYVAGARIYSLADGWVDKSNSDMFSAFKGYETNKQVRWLVEANARGRKELVKRGLPIGARIPITHKLIRDEKGKASHIELVPDKVQMMTYVARFLVDDHITYQHLGANLRDKYGILDSSGLVYERSTLYYLLHNPFVSLMEERASIALTLSQIPNDLWLLPVPKINQLLHQLFSHARIYIDKDLRLTIRRIGIH
ncbi:MAG: recombinase family protein [bacterium]|nr:recombinase family protein [bacterium]